MVLTNVSYGGSKALKCLWNEILGCCFYCLTWKTIPLPHFASQAMVDHHLTMVTDHDWPWSDHQLTAVDHVCEMEPMVWPWSYGHGHPWSMTMVNHGQTMVKIDHDLTMTWPWSDHDLTMIWLWSDHDLTMIWPWLDHVSWSSHQLVT